jgi:hypothetical protein
MNVINATAIARVALPDAASRLANREPARQTHAAATQAPVDAVTRQPIPPRFPWLSRLARELEPVSKQPSPYGHAPMLGEQLDQRA